MCIGVPMQVLEAEPGRALCEGPDGPVFIDTMLVGDVEPGAWLMVFLGAAREQISAEYAAQCRDALEALERVMRGQGDIDHLFADLINREPQWPECLTQAASASAAPEAPAHEAPSPSEKKQET
ncbi:MAG: HypC/HybG/HupF family hydrogenase formation chaperone [Neomegalonema sp.]|nr:HypC/HybG/HupF family hydrogenase formation chaperone [Neomegalonema sp.]